MKKLAIAMLALAMATPAFAQKKGGSEWMDAWTIGLRQNTATDLDSGIDAVTKTAFQGGILKSYDFFGPGALTFRTGALLTQRDAGVEQGTNELNYSRMDLVVPVTAHYAINPKFAVYGGLDVDLLKVSSSCDTTGSSCDVGDMDEVGMPMIPNVGLTYDFGGWALGFQYDMATEFAEDTKSTAMAINGIFTL
jgi:hypothetical protein